MHELADQNITEKPSSTDAALDAAEALRGQVQRRPSSNRENLMAKTTKSKLPDVWATGHPGVTVSPNHADFVAAHSVILGSTREGMGEEDGTSW